MEDIVRILRWVLLAGAVLLFALGIAIGWLLGRKFGTSPRHP